MRCSFCNDVRRVYAIMFVYHPVTHCSRRILDAQYFAQLMQVTDDHVVAFADRHWTWMTERNHGQPSCQYLSTLVPQCNQDSLRHLLEDPDTADTSEEEDVPAPVNIPGPVNIPVPVDVPVPIDVPVPVDGHASREQAAAEYELFCQYLVNNDYLDIYRHFRQHVVLLREADFYAYDPLPFPGVDDDV